VSRGGGGNILVNRTIDGVSSVFWTVLVCTALLVLVFSPAKGISLAGKGIDTLAIAGGATWTYLTQRAPDGVKKGNQLAGAKSAPANRNAPAAVR
jgi:hypothetical protein